jgi:hypothetical protein
MHYLKLVELYSASGLKSTFLVVFLCVWSIFLELQVVKPSNLEIR